ncbi:type II CAAX prenyl endopeptidase Rce1 family protein [Leifsonia sp. WHRI 6310E]|uniref:CPBP family glutamic-type intramembrane protease n=1 Tax=Leifsonia sp. WHRI 6310E TaxID=3162562 RepID=UPI0032EF0A63
MLNVVIALLLGAAFPVIVAFCSGKRTRLTRADIRPGRLVLLAASAAGEETIWRLGILTAFAATNTGLAIAIFLSVLGFIVLHALAFGWNVLPYIAVFTVVITPVFFALSWLGAIAFHIAHNVVVASTTNSSPPQRSASPASQVVW